MTRGRRTGPDSSLDPQALIDRIAAALEGLPEVGGAFLGGSHGRAEADAFSDVDVYAVAAEDADAADLLARLQRAAAEVAPLIYSRVLPNARTINCITTGWLRFDLTAVTGMELALLAGGEVSPLFDRLGLTAKLAAAPTPRAQPDADALLDIAHEFIRVLGLTTVVKGRDDPVVAETGANLLRDLLIRTMVLENGPRPRRGVLALGRDLTPGQMAELEALPPLEASWPSVFARTRAIAGCFLPRARALARELGAEWPEAFEAATREHLKASIGLDFWNADALA